MNDVKEHVNQDTQEASENDGPEDFFIDILSGRKERPSPKKLLIQKVLRQLIESYGFDRADLDVNYNPCIQGHGRKRVDIAIFRSGFEHINDNLQRIIVCKSQKKRDKLRSLTEAESDLRELKELMELFPAVSLGMWSNGQEDFLFQVERARFEVRHKPLGAWPVPPSVPISLIELSTHIILHKFNSPAWLKHIQKANAALSELTSEKMSHLGTGEAYVWASKSSDDAFCRGAVKIKCRPRATQHGGGTKTAVNN